MPVESAAGNVVNSSSLYKRASDSLATTRDEKSTSSEHYRPEGAKLTPQVDAVQVQLDQPVKKDLLSKVIPMESDLDLSLNQSPDRGQTILKTSEKTAIAVRHLSASTQVGEIAHLPKIQQIRIEDVEPGILALVDQVRQEFTELEKIDSPTWESLVVALEKLENRILEPFGRLYMLQSACYDDKMTEAIDHIQPAVVQLSLEMDQSREIYDALKKVQSTQSLTQPQKQAITNRLKGMVLKGVGLDGQQKERFVEIEKRLTKLGTDFGNNITEEGKTKRVKVDNPDLVKGIPAAILGKAVEKAKSDGVEEATPEAGPWHFTVDGANYSAVMKRCESSQLRETFYNHYYARCTGADGGRDNRPLLEEILALKQEKAKILGFDNYAQLSLDIKMAPSEEAVHGLIDQLKTAASPAAIKEMQTLTEFAHSRNSDIESLQPWDISYWTEQWIDSHYNIDHEALREYLQVPLVMDSLFEMMKSLFDLEISEVPAQCMSRGDASESVLDEGSTVSTVVPTWHEDVQFFEVKEKGEVIAGFYMDPYSRPGEKQQGAWMDDVVGRSTALAYGKRDSSIPVALFMMNARPPEEDKPGLFSLDEVETLFHEFGHALQHMLTKVDVGDVSGIEGVEWDAVEIASQLNENWVYRPEYLKSVSRHVETGDQLDDDTIAKIIESRHYWAANTMLRQLQFATTDFRLHQEIGVSDQPDGLTPYEIEQQDKSDFLKTPYVETDTMLPAFSHIFGGGYDAGYFSYMWALVIAADGFAAFEEAGLDDAEAVSPVAQRYRDTILAQGGSRPAAEVYREFRGRDATPEALLKQQGLLFSDE